jgi:hypothetical protein
LHEDAHAGMVDGIGIGGEDAKCHKADQRGKQMCVSHGHRMCPFHFHAPFINYCLFGL